MAGGPWTWLAWASTLAWLTGLHTAGVAGIGVAVFQEHSVPNTTAYLQYKGTLPDLFSFTICWRVKFLQMMNPSTLLSYAVKGYDNELYISIEQRFENLIIGCCQSDVLFSFDFEAKLIQWSSMCLTVDYPNSSASLVVDGEQRVVSSPSPLKDGTHLSGGGVLIIGQEQDNLGGGFDPYESLKAYLADLKFYSKAINLSYAMKYTKEPMQLEDSLMISFDNFENFYIRDVRTYEVDNIDQMVKQLTPFRKLFSNRITFDDGRKLCHSLGGTMTLLNSPQQMTDLFQMTSTTPVFCAKSMFSLDILWLGGTASKNESNWHHYATGEDLNYTNLWNEYETKNRDANCLTFYGCKSNSELWHKRWGFTGCDQSRRVACDFERFNILKLRGMCHGSNFDNEYFLNDTLVDANFIGVHSSFIVRMNSTSEYPSGYWRLFEPMSGGEAILPITVKSVYPIGLNAWNITKCRACAGLRNLILTSCNDRHFTCGDGSCILLDQRCDFEKDCTDSSDETHCTILVLPKDGYSSEIPPPRQHKNPFFELFIRAEILRVRNFDLREFSITMDLTLIIQWIDSFIKFANLKDEIQYNEISMIENQTPWLPSYSFLGCNETFSDEQPHGRQLFASKLSQPEPHDLTNIYAEEVFSGARNPLVMMDSRTLTSACSVNLVMFPFDFQLCIVYVKLRGNVKHAKLLPLNNSTLVEFKGDRSLLQYVVQDVTASVDNQHSGSVLTLRITLENRFVYYFINTYVPSVILLVIGYLTFYFSLDDFQDRVMVALTSLLVQTTFFTQVSDYVPRTSYLKMIDVWCVFCIVTLFTIILALTVTNYYLENSESSLQGPQPTKDGLSLKARPPKPAIKKNADKETDTHTRKLIYQAWTNSAPSSPRKKGNSARSEKNMSIDFEDAETTRLGSGDGLVETQIKAVDCCKRGFALRLNKFSRVLIPVVVIVFVVVYGWVVATQHH